MLRRPVFHFTIVAALATAVGCASKIPVSEGNAPLLEAIDAVIPSKETPQPPKPAVVASPYLGSPNVSPSGLAAVPAYPNANGQPAAGAPPYTGPAASGPPPGADPAAMQRVMAELQSLGNVDPAMQKQLFADFQQTDPALWPMMMQTFRAGMAYRQRQAGPVRETPTTIAEKPAIVAEKPATQFATVGNASAAEKTNSVTASSGPDPIPPRVSNVGASAVAAPATLPPMDALATPMNPRGSPSNGLSFPSAALLQAALGEAQRQEAAASAVQPVNHVQPQPDVGAEANVDWQQTLEQAIVALERETQEPPHSAHEVTRHAWLRMMYLAAGRRDDALKAIPGIAAVEQDFWSEQLFALATYLDTQKLSDPARRSAETAKHLAKATARLSEASTLTVKNLAFCTEVSSYGVYVKFKKDEFKANEPLILYAEVENFKSDDTAKGFHTALRSSYQIIDAQGRRVAENDLALTEEYCQNQRRDYFLRYFLSVPERIYAGKYTLQLTIVDTLSQKIGQSSIEFTVVDK
jgi:hypothetical protein